MPTPIRQKIAGQGKGRAPYQYPEPARDAVLWLGQHRRFIDGAEAVKCWMWIERFDYIQVDINHVVLIEILNYWTRLQLEFPFLPAIAEPTRFNEDHYNQVLAESKKMPDNRDEERFLDFTGATYAQPSSTPETPDGHITSDTRDAFWAEVDRFINARLETGQLREHGTAYYTKLWAILGVLPPGEIKDMLRSDSAFARYVLGKAHYTEEDQELFLLSIYGSHIMRVFQHVIHQKIDWKKARQYWGFLKQIHNDPLRQYRYDLIALARFYLTFTYPLPIKE